MPRFPPLPFLLLPALCAIAPPARAGDECPATPALDPITVGAGEAGGAEAEEAPPLRYVWVIDHSGSMYADYVAGQSRAERPYYVEMDGFRRLVVDGLGSSFHDGKDSAAIVAFNEYAYGWDGSLARRVGERGPGFDDLKVGSIAELMKRLEHLPPPPYGESTMGFPAPRAGANECGQAGAASNCSKMLEGLSAARTLLDGSGDGAGVIWLVTDNIYESGQEGSGLPAVELSANEDFYTEIRDTPEYRVVVAYPILQRKGSGGEWLGGTSLFVYGIYYDGNAARRTPVERVRTLLGDGSPGVLASDKLTALMTAYSAEGNPSPGRPFRLKPLDQELVRLSLAADVVQVKRHLQIGDKIQLKACISVQNLLDHRVIDTATFGVSNQEWVGYEPTKKGTAGTFLKAIDTMSARSFKGEAATVTDIGPRESKVVAVVLDAPAVSYKIRSAGDLFQMAMNDDVVMAGTLEASLSEVRSHLSIPPAALKGTYGAESLPGVFANPRVGEYTAEFVGKTKKIENPGTLLAGVSLAGLAAGAALFALGGFMLTSVSRRLVIDGAEKGAISIPRIRAVRIERGSELLARASLSFGGQLTLRGVGGYVARRDGEGWTLQKEHGPTVRVELRSTKRR